MQIWSECQNLRKTSNDSIVERVCLPNSDIIFTACSDWIAEYETFNIDDRAGSRNKLSLGIESSEVLTLLKQSLKPSPLGFWKCSFPMHISCDLTIFIILRTVVLTDFEDANDSHISCSTAQLPTDYHPRLIRSWSNSRELYDMTYTYEVALSANNQFLVFADRDFSEIQDTSLAAIFSIRLDAKVVHVEGITFTVPKSANRSFNSIQDCSFHPFGARMVYKYADSVVFWDFLEGRYPTNALIQSIMH